MVFRIARFAWIALVILVAAPATARDFVIRPVDLPTPGEPTDSGRWIDNDVTPDGKHHVGFVQTYLSTDSFYEVIYSGPDEAVTVDAGLVNDFGFVNVNANPQPWLSIEYQEGMPTEFNPISGSLFRNSVPPNWMVYQPGLPIISGSSAQYVSVDRASGFRQVAYFDVDADGDGFGALRWAQTAYPDYTSEFVSDVYINRDRGHPLAIRVDQFDEPRIAFLGSDHSVKYARRIGGAWTVETVTIMLGIGQGHVDLALDGAGNPFISFYRIDSQDLMLATRDFAGTWTVETIASNGRVGKWNSIAIDPAGVPFVSAYRDSDRALVLVTPAPGGIWDTDVIDTNGDVGEYSSIDIDAYGGIHIAYRGPDAGRPLYAWWLDWNVNGVHDQTDIANGLLADCNGNSIPDEAEILFGFADDCDLDGVPDECGIDCDDNGVLDVCQLAAIPSDDCDGNGTVDACQIAADPSLDCDADGIFDTCGIAQNPSLDCDGNGSLDTCEISAGTGDENGNLVLDVCESPAIVDISGLPPFYNAGLELQSGNFDGDAFGDLVVRGNSGVKIYRGSVGGDTVADFQIAGSYESVAVGDFALDGRSDLLLGNPGGSQGGSVDVFRGDASGLLVYLGDLDAPDSGSDFGAAVAFADVDGDGQPDFVVGAPSRWSSQAGRVYVYYSQPLDGTPDQVWDAPDSYDRDFGSSLTNAGDLDGDGLDDVVVGSPALAINDDAAHVYFSRLGGPSERGPALIREDPSGGFATTLAGAGDLNGDGYDDLLIGHPLGFSADGAVGQVLVYYGGAPMDAQADAYFRTRPPGSTLGTALATGHDLDGDGYDDILIGATDYTQAGLGVVQVYFGGTTLDTEPDLVVADVEIRGGTGASATFVDDFDGDGIMDFAAGAPFEGSSNVGKVRLRSVLLPDFADCDGNGIRDLFDIANGAPDVNDNSIPDGCEEIPTSVDEAGTPRASRLVGAFPTPFNPRTTIVFELAQAGQVELGVYNAAGRRVATLVNGSLSAGRHEIIWNARSRGARLASGVYFVALRGTDLNARLKIVLLK